VNFQGSNTLLWHGPLEKLFGKNVFCLLNRDVKSIFFSSFMFFLASVVRFRVDVPNSHLLFNVLGVKSLIGAVAAERTLWMNRVLLRKCINESVDDIIWKSKGHLSTRNTRTNVIAWGTKISTFT